MKMTLLRKEQADKLRNHHAQSKSRPHCIIACRKYSTDHWHEIRGQHGESGVNSRGSFYAVGPGLDSRGEIPQLATLQLTVRNTLSRLLVFDKVKV
jgi:hypothetical protein